MRRLAPLLLALLLVPTAFAERLAGDGSLAVNAASARILVVDGTGVIYGHIDQGTLTILEYKPAGTSRSAGTSTPQVTPADLVKLPVGSATQYFGSDIRFLLPNGSYRLRLDGVGIDISAAGKGAVTAIGTGAILNGTMATNGGKPLPLGSGPTTLVFGPGKAPNAVPRAARVAADVATALTSKASSK